MTYTIYKENFERVRVIIEDNNEIKTLVFYDTTLEEVAHFIKALEGLNDGK